MLIISVAVWNYVSKIYRQTLNDKVEKESTVRRKKQYIVIKTYISNREILKQGFARTRNLYFQTVNYIYLSCWVMLIASSC